MTIKFISRRRFGSGRNQLVQREPGADLKTLNLRLWHLAGRMLRPYFFLPLLK